MFCYSIQKDATCSKFHVFIIQTSLPKERNSVYQLQQHSTQVVRMCSALMSLQKFTQHTYRINNVSDIHVLEYSENSSRVSRQCMCNITFDPIAFLAVWWHTD